jgi:hypothetical protein
MSIPQRNADESDDDFPALVGLEPGAKRQVTNLGDEYDPEAAIALLRQFREEPSEDPEADWAEFLEFARAIDEDRLPGQKLFEKYYAE